MRRERSHQPNPDVNDACKRRGAASALIPPEIVHEQIKRILERVPRAERLESRSRLRDSVLEPAHHPPIDYLRLAAALFRTRTSAPVRNPDDARSDVVEPLKLLLRAPRILISPVRILRVLRRSEDVEPGHIRAVLANRLFER